MNIDLDVFVVKFLEFFLQFVNILTTLTNDDAWTCGANCNGDKLKCTLNNYARDASLSEALVEILTDLHILYEAVTEVLTTEPI